MEDVNFLPDPRFIEIGMLFVFNINVHVCTWRSIDFHHYPLLVLHFPEKPLNVGFIDQNSQLDDFEISVQYVSHHCTGFAISKLTSVKVARVKNQRKKPFFVGVFVVRFVRAAAVLKAESILNPYSPCSVQRK